MAECRRHSHHRQHRRSAISCRREARRAAGSDRAATARTPVVAADCRGLGAPRRRRRRRLLLVAASSGAIAGRHRFRQRPARGRRDRYRHQICRPHRRNSGRRRRSGESRPGRRPHGHAGPRRLAEEIASPGPTGEARRSKKRTPMSSRRTARCSWRKQEMDRAVAYLVQKGFETKEAWISASSSWTAPSRRCARRKSRVIRVRARARRGDPRRRTLQCADRRQYAGRPAYRPHRIPHRQYRRGASCRRQSLRHARYRRMSIWTSICRPRPRAK